MGNFTSAESDLIGMGGGGLMTALAGPSTASPTSAAWALPWPQTSVRQGPSAEPAVSAESAPRRCWPRPAGVVHRPAVGAAQLGRRTRNPGGEHARHAGVAELGRRRTRGDVDRDSGHHGRHARGRQRRSRRLQLRSPALRRQAQGHAVDSQADAHLRTQAANGGRLNLKHNPIN